MDLFLTLFIGLVVGVIARFFMPGRDPGGIFVTMLLGVTGAFIAGWLGRAAGVYREGFSGPGFVASVFGAMIVLLFHRLATGSRATEG